MSKRTVLLCVAYDGAPYSGAAVQQNARTVGGELLAAIRHLDPAVDKIRIASRTDAGVHARDQRVAFDTKMTIPTRGWVLGLTRHLPPSIAVRHASQAPVGFNPRFEATRKRYRYLLLCERLNDPFYAGRAWRVGGLAFDDHIERIEGELALAAGTHNFAAFASSRDKREHTERTLHKLTASRLSEVPLVTAIDIAGDGFLHNMVRILVGTAVDVARERIEPGAISRALESRDRRDAGVTAPAEGLYLEQVQLRSEGTDRWPPVETRS